VISRVIRRWALAVVLLGALPAIADAQVFLATRPHPAFEIGPLFVRASVHPALGPTIVDLYFSLAIPPTRSAADFEQDLFLLWPGEVGRDGGPNALDEALSRYVVSRGFAIIAAGHLPLASFSLYQRDGKAAREDIPGGAPFVTFVREGGPLGLTSPASYIRIPWTAALVNRAKLVDLRITLDGAVKPMRQAWIERAFWGPRHRITISFNDVHGRALFPLYFENRDRMLKLSDDLSEILINFSDSDRLKIERVAPPTATRKTSEALESTEVVSLFLDRSEGMAPQVLAVEFAYFSGLQSWAPILIPVLFFAAGNLAGPLVSALARRLANSVTSRFHVGRADDPAAARQTGTVLDRETLARIVPGETTRDEVYRLCGANAEEFEQVGGGERRTLIYRGRRVVPQRRRTWGWLATVDHWDVEHYEVEIELEEDRVRDVQARVRRVRSASGRLPS
jgi:hypothetical protein